MLAVLRLSGPSHRVGHRARYARRGPRVSCTLYPVGCGPELDFRQNALEALRLAMRRLHGLCSSSLQRQECLLRDVRPLLPKLVSSQKAYLRGDAAASGSLCICFTAIIFKFGRTPLINAETHCRPIRVRGGSCDFEKTQIGRGCSTNTNIAIEGSSTYLMVLLVRGVHYLFAPGICLLKPNDGLRKRRSYMQAFRHRHVTCQLANKSWWNTR